MAASAREAEVEDRLKYVDVDIELANWSYSYSFLEKQLRQWKLGPLTSDGSPGH